MDPLSISASVAAVLQISSCVASSAYRFWSGGAATQQAVSTLHDKLHELEKLLRALQSLIEEHATHFSTYSSHVHDWLGWLQDCDSLLNSFAQKLHQTLSMFQMAKSRLRWPLTEKEMIKLAELVEAKKSSITIGLIIDGIDISLQTKQNTNLLRSREDERLRREIQAWFEPVNAEQDYDAARNKCHSGTGRWLLRGDDYLRWKDGHGSILWLHGIPGAGKTVLAATIIKSLIEEKKYHSSTGVIFFFFTFADRRKQNVRSMLATIAAQLLQKLTTVPKQVYATFKNKPGKPSTGTILEILGILLGHFEQVYLVIDALDEVSSRERSPLLETVCHLANGTTHPNLNMIVTSRRETYIQDAFDSLQITEMRMDGGVVDNDIRTFISQHLRHDPSFRKWNVSVLADIEMALTSKAHGMFRWVECQLEMLKSCRNANGVRRILQALPPTLDETYRRILSSIPDYDAPFAKHALMWLAFSRRPLTVEELAEAVILKSGLCTIDADERFPDPKEILSICGTLVTVIGDNEKAYKGYVRLSHYSVKEYLVSSRAQDETPFALNLGECIDCIADLCLTYLSLESLASNEGLDDWARHGFMVWQSNRRKHPLLDYAGLFWTDHLKLVKGEKRIELETRTAEFLTSAGGRLSIPSFFYARDVFHLHSLTKSDGRYAELDSLLCCFAASGLETAVQLCIERGADANASYDGIYESPLQAAILNGHLSIVKTLVEHGASVSRISRWAPSALQMAIEESCDNIARLLIEHGADVNARERNSTVLLTAIIKNNQSMVQYLLDRGAEPCLAAKDGTPLAAAVRRGSLSLVQLLLSRGANINAPAEDSWQFSAIAEAALSGNEELLDLLVAEGADVNALNDCVFLEGGERCCTALYRVDDVSGWYNQERRERAEDLLLRYGARREVRLMDL